MRAVHFGAGNIGRGFIGALLDQSGYHTTFVDVNKTIIDEINEKINYRVILADENKQEQIVKNISGIVSSDDPEKVIEAIVEADIISTAVGPHILPFIAELLTNGLRRRLISNAEPVNIIACENMIGGSTLLKEKIFDHLNEDEKVLFEQSFGFPDSAVDRIVPNQTNEELLTVSVEPYYEWVVDASKIKGEKPEITGITYVDDLLPYIERKLFTVNTGHAVAAYTGYHFGYPTIQAAMEANEVKEIVRNALSETGDVLIKLYGFDKSIHQNYIDKILTRFLNPYISDEVTRVARGPLRKLGAKDRFIRPASLYTEQFSKAPENLSKAIAAALVFDYDQDEEAVKLQTLIKEKGYEGALKEVSELDSTHPLTKQVLQEVEKIQA
ncbi:mannitol-1-phosphate 5-dehydrogenase [Saliterribacillus persicus]|uniref:Mannitol-1-phosphate 5-dehydrogenase n=1 Tax=Saliterribacillus persicus TaxID=930114 RepID=A0A368Y9X2_9BACI|nr:mannitol-1-phosphate 5-dehydrogenase [Saliterribacillus persicus]RCW76915.1 D-mannitol 1-phosphate 5-dehydrogenase [Saliterribacillus persicus]